MSLKPVCRCFCTSLQSQHAAVLNADGPHVTVTKLTCFLLQVSSTTWAPVTRCGTCCWSSCFTGGTSRPASSWRTDTASRAPPPSTPRHLQTTAGRFCRFPERTAAAAASAGSTAASPLWLLQLLGNGAGPSCPTATHRRRACRPPRPLCWDPRNTE